MRDEHSKADDQGAFIVTTKERMYANANNDGDRRSTSQESASPDDDRQRTPTSPHRRRRHLEHSVTLPSMTESRNLPFFPPPRPPLPLTTTSTMHEHVRRNRSASEATAHLMQRPISRSPPSSSSSTMAFDSGALGSATAPERFVLPPLSSLSSNGIGSGVGFNGIGSSASSGLSGASPSSSTLPTLSRFSANIRRSNTISSVLRSPLSGAYGSSNTVQAGPTSTSPFRPLSSGTNRPSSLSVSSLYPPSLGTAATTAASSSPHRIFSRNISSKSPRSNGPFQRVPVSPPVTEVGTFATGGVGVLSPSSSSTITSSSAGDGGRPRANSFVVDGGEDGAPRKLAKTHVPSACLNCKRAHLACDVNRPCRRCVNLGKTETCIDVRHKKRGRPRLRDRDSSAQSAQRAPVPAEVQHDHTAARRSSVHMQLPPQDTEMRSNAVLSMIYSTSLYCVRCSLECEAVLGFEASDLLHRSLFDLVHPSDLPRIEGLWRSLLSPVHIRPQGLYTHPDVIATLSPAELMAPATGTVFLQEDHVHLRQRNGHYRTVSVRLHLGGGMGADLYHEETLDRAYIVASIHPQDDGADSRARRRVTDGDTMMARPRHPDPNVLRLARWHSGHDPRHFVTPTASYGASAAPPPPSSNYAAGFGSSGRAARDDGNTADAEMRGRRQQPMHMVVC